MDATSDGATDDTKETHRPHRALSIISKRRVIKHKYAHEQRPKKPVDKASKIGSESQAGKRTSRKGGRSQRRLGVTIDDQHHASGPTTSHHLKKRYKPPPSVKLATELERAPIPQWRRQTELTLTRTPRKGQSNCSLRRNITDRKTLDLGNRRSNLNRGPTHASTRSQTLEAA
ncbi:hypothetical protein Bca4012_096302 [Brassica carinata]